jgi:hypothetical protein
VAVDSGTTAAGAGGDEAVSHKRCEDSNGNGCRKGFNAGTQ